MQLDALVSSLENQCKVLPEWGRVKMEVVRKISDELAAHIWEVRKYVSQTGCQIVFNRKENKVTIIKPKVSKEDEDLLAGLDNLDTNIKGLDEEVTQKEKEVVQKEKEVVQKEKEVVQKEKEVVQKEKEVEIAEKINYLVNNLDKLSYKKVVSILKEIKFLLGSIWYCDNDIIEHKDAILKVLNLASTKYNIQDVNYMIMKIKSYLNISCQVRL